MGVGKRVLGDSGPAENARRPDPPRPARSVPVPVPDRIRTAALLIPLIACTEDPAPTPVPAPLPRAEPTLAVGDLVTVAEGVTLRRAADAHAPGLTLRAAGPKFRVREATGAFVALEPEPHCRAVIPGLEGFALRLFAERRSVVPTTPPETGCAAQNKATTHRVDGDASVYWSDGTVAGTATAHAFVARDAPGATDLDCLAVHAPTLDGDAVTLCFSQGSVHALGNGGGHRRPLGKVKRGEVAVDGALPQIAAARLVRMHTAELRVCYDEVLRRVPQAAGDATLILTAGGSGRVTTVAVERSTIDDEAFNLCLAEAPKRWAVPVAPDGLPSTIRAELEFEPG